MTIQNDIYKKEIVKQLEPFVATTLEKYQSEIKDYWQPSDYLPDFSKENWVEEVNALQSEASGLSDKLIAVIVGDMITEEALPNYQSWLNRYSYIKDETGVSDNPWAQWIRGWTAEENRHGDLLAGYLNMSGRVDMKAVNQSVHSLLKNGFDTLTGSDPYAGMIYTSFQERATKVSHRNTGIIAGKQGAKNLQKICAIICADEKRHEEVYQSVTKELLSVDPNGIMITLEKMLKATIVMPAKNVEDGFGNALFDDFSAIAQEIEVYTAKDYTDILEYLLKLWDIGSVTGLNAEASKAQDFICKLPARYEKLAKRFNSKPQSVKIPWITSI
jgi:acyl-[acyl-carrier-protein] desaturase